MYLSKNWLKQYLPKGIPLEGEKLQERLTFSVAEVEGIVKIGDNLKNIVVGQIKKIKAHPKSEKLQIATVDAGGSQKRTIVCAAQNIFEGAIVPIALPGAVVLNPKQELGEQDNYEIKDTQIMNVKSQGMLCSQKELGISNNHEGIWILTDEVKVGDDFIKFISDTILEIENKSLTHRSDGFCHLGIAREISAILKTPFNNQKSRKAILPTAKLPLKIKIDDKKLCKRYTAITMKGIKVSPSPLWMQIRLLSIGIRPINNIVDLTNYIMLDIGQPLHAFDYDKLSDKKIIVRTAKQGEKLETLDGVERELTKENLLICDPKVPIAIAGVMGGADTEIDDNTKNIIIESANFEMYNIRRTSSLLGLRTDASTRFEKGLDPNLTNSGIERFIELFNDINEGEIASEMIDIYPEPVEERTIEFETLDIPRILGINPSKAEVIDILKSLQLKVDDNPNDTKLEVTIPTFRKDLNIKEDLLEDIARIYGYDKFKPTLPSRDLRGVKLNKRREFNRKIKELFSSLGFDEIYSYSFCSEAMYKNTLLDIKSCLKLKNPISPELLYMRNSLVPSILSKLQINQANFDKIQIYESSRIYLKENSKENLPKQPVHISGLISSPDSDNAIFYKLKGRIESLLKNVNVFDIRFEKTKDIKYLHPNKQSLIYSDKTVIGHIGTIHPLVKNNLKLINDTSLFVLNFDKLIQKASAEKTYQRIYKYPQVKRDLSFWVDYDSEVGILLEKISKSKYKYIDKLEISDIYFPQKSMNRKSITLQATLQSKEKTLSEKEITSDMKSLIGNISKIGGNLRRS